MPPCLKSNVTPSASPQLPDGCAPAGCCRAFLSGAPCPISCNCTDQFDTKADDSVAVMGLAYKFEQAGAKATIASLWVVNDASTSQLMQQFYKNLAIGTMSKAEALRQAQRSLMQVRGSAKQTRSDSFKLPATDGSKPSIARDFSHPYYWAPFILIGNNL